MAEPAYHFLELKPQQQGRVQEILETLEQYRETDGNYYIPPELIEIVDEQPRNFIDPDELESLAIELEKSGINQPVLVQPKATARRGERKIVQIVGGERRFRGWTHEKGCRGQAVSDQKVARNRRATSSNQE